MSFFFSSSFNSLFSLSSLLLSPKTASFIHPTPPSCPVVSRNQSSVVVPRRLHIQWRTTPQPSTKPAMKLVASRPIPDRFLDLNRPTVSVRKKKEEKREERRREEEEERRKKNGEDERGRKSTSGLRPRSRSVAITSVAANILSNPEINELIVSVRKKTGERREKRRRRRRKKNGEEERGRKSLHPPKKEEGRRRMGWRGTCQF